jgi:membrane fusion protein (multidrug efflux system)
MKNITIIFSTVVLAGFLAACGDSNSVEAKKAKLEKLKTQQSDITAKIATLQEELIAAGDTSINEVKGKLVAITTLTPSLFEHNIDVQGRVDGDENIAITPKMSGTVTRVNVQAGDRVSKGQILAEIDNELVKSQLAELKNSYELAKDLYNRQKALWDQKVGTEIQYLQAKNNKESLEQKVKQVSENLDMYYFKAPFNGTVDEVTLKAGQIVGPASVSTYIRVINFDKLKIKTDLSESYASKVKIGDMVTVIFPDINKTVTSKVIYAGKAINAATRTFGVEIALPSSTDYNPNMVAVVSITDYKNPKAMVVPINTIQNENGAQYVFVAVHEGNSIVAKKRTVSVGAMYKDIAEIKDGLKEGDQLITTGYQEINDGETIKL